jgi:uncharacterized protein (TIGR03437 family)
LPTVFNGTEVNIGGLDAPLYFTSAGQLNAEIPSELAPDRQYQAVVIVNNVPTTPITINLVPVAPGVSSFSDGRLIAQHADYSLVTPTSPAQPNEVLVMYLAGMGATQTPVATGKVSPATQVSTPATVTVDGQPAQVFYAGLTPGGIGLYQINFQVPASAKSGTLPVVVTQGGVTANQTMLPVGN